MNATSASSAKPAPVQQPPWWRLPIVWMVIAGPAIAVVASFVSLGYAIKYRDPVLDTSKDQVQGSHAVEAEQARNHANDGAREPAER